MGPAFGMGGALLGIGEARVGHAQQGSVGLLDQVDLDQARPRRHHLAAVEAPAVSEAVHRLAYSFGWDGSEVVPPGSSLVEIDLIEQPNGTLLRLTHTGLPNAEQCAGHAEGWAHYLGRLAEVAAGRDPGPDPRHSRTGSV